MLFCMMTFIPTRHVAGGIRRQPPREGAVVPARPRPRRRTRGHQQSFGRRGADLCRRAGQFGFAICFICSPLRATPVIVIFLAASHFVFNVLPVLWRRKPKSQSGPKSHGARKISARRQPTRRVCHARSAPKPAEGDTTAFIRQEIRVTTATRPSGFICAKSGR